MAVDTFVDYYELLHVQPSAPEPVIKASYRAMMQKLNHHPDRGGDVGFAQLLNDAVSILCNPKTRAEYDALKHQIDLAAASPLADKQKRDDSSASSWGEPGGSPSKHKEKKPKQSEQAESKPKDANNASASTTTAEKGYPPLPSRPQCPFCLSTYPSDGTVHTTPFSNNDSRRCRNCKGARTPIAHVAQTSNDELRKMHRQHYQSNARLWLSWPCSAPFTSVLSDFSPAGCAVIYSQAIAIGQIVMIETELFNAICHVRHCKATPQHNYLAGLEFVTLDMQSTPGALLRAKA